MKHTMTYSENYMVPLESGQLNWELHAYLFGMYLQLLERCRSSNNSSISFNRHLSYIKESMSVLPWDVIIITVRWLRLCLRLDPSHMFPLYQIGIHVSIISPKLEQLHVLTTDDTILDKIFAILFRPNTYQITCRRYCLLSNLHRMWYQSIFQS